ncbi:hypothetical protein KCTC32516_02198 [Polaribacter huanghezhanensis]|uniref:DUF2141 domain-containing protein n=1 Tax=Polaribacter huanghezhanensis TaxID=1354726 RepID=UPI002649B592|nr:DUF2141 domain-containing protein [Polaribacter huanghezhanensis]WKD86818.1 hypothetical protein KCTC32516_02198 [Polaribacter huanghezhanensis]
MKVFTAIFAFVVVFQTSMYTAKKTNTEKRTITVLVTNVSSDKGTVSYALYDKENFMKVPVQAKSSSPKGKKSTVVFTDIESGNYAIICFHDENNNDKIDFQPNGMPLEDYGVSNNPMSFGPPNFDEAQFEVSDKNVTLEIKF